MIQSVILGVCALIVWTNFVIFFSTGSNDAAKKEKSGKLLTLTSLISSYIGMYFMHTDTIQSFVMTLMGIPGLIGLIFILIFSEIR